MLFKCAGFQLASVAAVGFKRGKRYLGVPRLSFRPLAFVPKVVVLFFKLRRCFRKLLACFGGAVHFVGKRFFERIGFIGGLFLRLRLFFKLRKSPAADDRFRFRLLNAFFYMLVLVFENSYIAFKLLTGFVKLPQLAALAVAFRFKLLKGQINCIGTLFERRDVVVGYVEAVFCRRPEPLALVGFFLERDYIKQREGDSGALLFFVDIEVFFGFFGIDAKLRKSCFQLTHDIADTVEVSPDGFELSLGIFLL